MRNAAKENEVWQRGAVQRGRGFDKAGEVRRRMIWNFDSVRANKEKRPRLLEYGMQGKRIWNPRGGRVRIRSCIILMILGFARRWADER